MQAIPPANSDPNGTRKERRESASRARSLARDVKRQEKYLAKLKHQQNKEVGR